MVLDKANVSCVKAGPGIETGPTQPGADPRGAIHDFLAHTQPGRMSVAFEYHNAAGMIRDISTDRSFRVTANQV